MGRNGPGGGAADGEGRPALPKILKERVAWLHMEKLRAKLIQLTPKHAEYIGLRLGGSY